MVHPMRCELHSAHTRTKMGESRRAIFVLTRGGLDSESGRILSCLFPSIKERSGNSSVSKMQPCRNVHKLPIMPPYDKHPRVASYAGMPIESS